MGRKPLFYAVDEPKAEIPIETPAVVSTPPWSKLPKHILAGYASSRKAYESGLAKIAGLQKELDEAKAAIDEAEKKIADFRKIVTENGNQIKAVSITTKHARGALESWTVQACQLGVETPIMNEYFKTLQETATP